MIPIFSFRTEVLFSMAGDVTAESRWFGKPGRVFNVAKQVVGVIVNKLVA